MTRALMDPANRAVTKTLSCYSAEWDALEQIAGALNFKTPFDAMRWLARASADPAVKKLREQFRKPNTRKSQ